MNHPDIQELKKLLDAGSVINESIQSSDYFKLEKPETLLIEEIEQIWNQIAENDDWSLFNQKLQSIQKFKKLYKL